MKKTPIVASSEPARKKYEENIMMLERMESMFGKKKENKKEKKEKYGTE